MPVWKRNIEARAAEKIKKQEEEKSVKEEKSIKIIAGKQKSQT